MLYAQIHLTLPAWVHESVDAAQAHASDADKVALAIELSRINTEAATGGPFGAAIFEEATHRLIAPGVNVVVPQANPTAHAEIVAMGIAGSLLNRYNLGDDGARPAVLATSVEPCAMCLGICDPHSPRYLRATLPPSENPTRSQRTPG